MSYLAYVVTIVGQHLLATRSLDGIICCTLIYLLSSTFSYTPDFLEALFSPSNLLCYHMLSALEVKPRTAESISLSWWLHYGTVLREILHLGSQFDPSSLGQPTISFFALLSVEGGPRCVFLCLPFPPHCERKVHS